MISEQKKIIVDPTYSRLTFNYKYVIISIQLFEEYVIQYAIWFQKHILHQNIKKFEYYNLRDVHKFYKDYVYH